MTEQDTVTGTKAACHPNRAEHAKGLCASCYRRQYPRATEKFDPELPSKAPERVQIRYQNPKVAAHVAAAVVKNDMDMQAAVKSLHPELSPVQVAQQAHTLENARQIQEAIEKELERLGLDEDSKKTYVKRMWDWMLNGTEKRAIAAARILGRAFISEKIDLNKPQDLPIKDFGAGVSQMLRSAGEEEEVLAVGIVGGGGVGARADRDDEDESDED